jgi:hypothetical protein
MPDIWAEQQPKVTEYTRGGPRRRELVFKADKGRGRAETTSRGYETDALIGGYRVDRIRIEEDDAWDTVRIYLVESTSGGTAQPRNKYVTHKSGDVEYRFQATTRDMTIGDASSAGLTGDATYHDFGASDEDALIKIPQLLMIKEAWSKPIPVMPKTEGAAFTAAADALRVIGKRLSGDNRYLCIDYQTEQDGELLLTRTTYLYRDTAWGEFYS